MSRAISYQYSFTADRQDNKFVCLDPNLDCLVFGLTSWFTPYLVRREPSFEMSLYDYGLEGFPVINITISMVKSSAEQIQYQLEVTVVPSKLADIHREMLNNVLELILKSEDIKVWYSNDPRGPRKRSTEDRQTIVSSVKEMPTYSGTNDISLDDIVITVKDALKFFGYGINTKQKELKKTFKSKVRELQLKHHPDSSEGDEATFMHLQKCKEVLEDWIKK